MTLDEDLLLLAEVAQSSKTKDSRDNSTNPLDHLNTFGLLLQQQLKRLEKCAHPSNSFSAMSCVIVMEGKSWMIASNL